MSQDPPPEDHDEILSPSSMRCPTCDALLDLTDAGAATEGACPACGAILALQPSPTPRETELGATITQPPQSSGPGQPTLETALYSADAETVAGDSGGAKTSTTKQLRGTDEVRYTLGEELARGGMGAVLSAKDLNLRRDVAMKVVLRPERARNDQIVRFVHEAQVTGQLEHPSIVPVYELGVDAENKVYYTMKYIRGTTLSDILKGLQKGDVDLLQTFPLPRLLDVFIKACDALAFAHSRGVIHRDLKPDNLMIGDFGEVLVVDWGLAKVLGENAPGTEAPMDTPGQDTFVESIRDGESGISTRTMDGAIMGTPAYMAPEQADGDLSRMGPSADIYAMGAILYAILTLEAPFSGDSLNAILDRVRAGDFIPPHQFAGAHPHCLGGRIPSALSAVVVKAMAKDPADRYPRVQALQADVQAYLDGFATGAEEAGPWRLLQLFLARHRAMALSILLANVVLMATVAAAFTLNVTARQAAVAEGAVAQDALATLNAEQARGLEARRAAAPALINAARSMIEEGDFVNAWLQVNLARQYDPELPAAHMLAAQLRIVDGDHAEALENLARYRALSPEDPLAERLIELCRGASSQHRDLTRAAIISLFALEEAWELADQLIQQQDAALREYDQRIRSAWPEGMTDPKWGGRRPDGSLHVAHLPKTCTDLSPLKGMPISTLNLKGFSRLRDLSPLQGMPLRDLTISHSKVTDLSPLAGAPLRELTITETPLSDLSPLSGAPLKKLSMAQVKVEDLSPLEGMPIKELHMGGCTQISDLTPLRSLPLEVLLMPGCWRVSDLSPLAGLPLRRLDLRDTRKAEDLSPLATCTALEELDLQKIRVESLEPLRGLPLRTLHLWGPTITSLDALTGMPLEQLRLFGCQDVDDLTPIAAMPLHTLSIQGSSITNLSPLAGLPLKQLSLFGSPEIEDISVIPTLKTLESLALPPRFEPIDFLDKLPSLRRVGHDPLIRKSVLEYRKQQAARQKAIESQP